MRIELLKEYIEEEPKNPFLRYALALELVKAGQVSEATDLFKFVHSNFPDYLPNYYHYASLHLRFDRLDEACDILEKGFELAKNQGDQHTASELRGLMDQIQQ